jgi:hypothetical protein
MWGVPYHTRLARLVAVRYSQSMGAACKSVRADSGSASRPSITRRAQLAVLDVYYGVQIALRLWRLK